VGPVVVDDIQADAAFSNIRLRVIGFRFGYPTLELGLPQVLGAIHLYPTLSTSDGARNLDDRHFKVSRCRVVVE
jgi:hypothetical protein